MVIIGRKTKQNKTKQNKGEEREENYWFVCVDACCYYID